MRKTFLVVGSLFLVTACSSSKEQFTMVEKCGRGFFQSDKRMFGVVNNQLQALFDGTYKYKSSNCQFTLKNGKFVE